MNTQLLDTAAFLGNDTEYYKQYTSRIVSLYINSTFYSYYSRLNNVVLIAPQGHYPCLCLCFGFSQITLMLPFLLMILHFSQIGFTDDLTFTSNPPFIHCLNYVYDTFSFKIRNSYIFTHKNTRKRAYIVYIRTFPKSTHIFKTY